MGGGETEKKKGQRKDAPGGSFHYGPTTFLQFHCCPALGSLRHRRLPEKLGLFA